MIIPIKKVIKKGRDAQIWNQAVSDDKKFNKIYNKSKNRMK